MKQYDKAYTEAPSKKETDYYMDKMGDNFPLKEHTDVIVLTISELKDFYIEGFEEGYDSAAYSDGAKKCNESFDNYLKTKLLTIKQQ